MANNGDWLPARKRDLADLCQKWKTGLENLTNVTKFSWKQAEVTETLTAVSAFLTARTAYEDVFRELKHWHGITSCLCSTL